MIFACLVFSSSAQMAVETSGPSAQPKSVAGTYQIYGGSLADLQPPTAGDAHVSFRFKGQSARDLFQSIGPDIKKQDACSSAPDYRERRRGHLLCVHANNDGYSCYLGLDLRKGKSDFGAVC